MGDTSWKPNNIFQYSKDFRDVRTNNLLRGVADFGNLIQFNPYKSGYAAFIVCGLPKFLTELAKKDPSGYGKLIYNWKHIIEYEFKSFDGLEDMSADTIDLGDDINKVNVISKVNWNSAVEFSLNYEEKSGTPLTKFAKLYLTGLSDPKTTVKHYHGLIHKGILEPGFENEVFSFLYINTDDTMKSVENATLIIAAQLNSADTGAVYGGYTKGDIGKKEITVKFNGYPITSSYIDKYAQNCLDYLIGEGDYDNRDITRIAINSTSYDYANSKDAIANAYRSWVSKSKDTYTGGTAKSWHYDNTGKFNETKSTINANPTAIANAFTGKDEVVAKAPDLSESYTELYGED